MSSNLKSLYVHIPFCKQKCYYCDFNSYAGKEELVERYVNAVEKEIDTQCVEFEFDNSINRATAQQGNISSTSKKSLPLRRAVATGSNNSFSTIYFGGGTPSVIDSKYIVQIMNQLQCDGEVTLELNPGTITKQKLEDYKSAGINRLSIGLQTTNDNLLKSIGRIHTLKDFDDAYKMAREVGFKNISVDLMIGLSNQTLEDVEQSIQYILKINPEHVSVYSLIVHDELKEKHPNAFSNLPSDEDERKMYYLVCDELKNAGYIQYEISNFAKPGFESKHNLHYWNQDEYFGVGAGASSYINCIRYKNIDSIEEYISKIENGESVAIIEEEQTKESKLREYMILKLRLLEGVSVKEAKKSFDIDILEYFKQEISKMEKKRLLEKLDIPGDTRVALTKKGLDFANVVWEEFV